MRHRIISEGVGLEWYVSELEKARERLAPGRGWLWGDHILPHDAAVRELGTGKSRIEVLAGLGIGGTLCPNMPVEDGIQAVRMLLPNCWFDKAKCKKGLEALRMYRREYDEKRQEFRTAPLHDWTSHYADAFRTFAMGHQERPVFARRFRRRRGNGWVA